MCAAKCSTIPLTGKVCIEYGHTQTGLYVEVFSSCCWLVNNKCSLVKSHHLLASYTLPVNQSYLIYKRVWWFVALQHKININYTVINGSGEKHKRTHNRNRKEEEGNGFFNDTLNTFFGYMASDIW